MIKSIQTVAMMSDEELSDYEKEYDAELVNIFDMGTHGHGKYKYTFRQPEPKPEKKETEKKTSSKYTIRDF